MTFMRGTDPDQITSLLKTSFFPDSLMDHLTFFPAFLDVHVHFREPGFSYKETIRSGTKAAAHGGYSAVCTMPNLRPVPDCRDHLEEQLALIRRDACVRVIPYGSITCGEAGETVSDMEALAPDVCAFSDDGKGVQNPAVMREAMQRARALGKRIVAHCEDNRLLRGGVIHDGAYAAMHGYAGICSESEWKPIERDLELVRETGCGYHVCHISTAESVDLIRRAKAEGLPVSCETAPHYLLLDEGCLQEDGRFKMNPPLRSASDREALIAGLQDGTIDLIATDHAPHSVAEKSRGLRDSPFGIVGLECAFPLLYTGLVRTGILPLERLTELLAEAPRRRFGIPQGGDFTAFLLDEEDTVDSQHFFSLGKSTPFEGWRVYGRCMLTVSRGRVAYADPMLSPMLRESRIDRI